MIFGGGKKALELADAHYEKVLECYESFCAFMCIYFEGGSREELREAFNRLDCFEKEADDLRAEVVDQLLTGALLPATRKEILELGLKVDKIANRAQDTARQLVLEKVELPLVFKDEIMQIIQYTKEQLEKLTDLIEMLFSNYDNLVKDHSLIDEVRAFESKVDHIEHDLIRRTFEMDTIDAAEKNQCRYFIRHIANISDHLENIADDIQIMMVYRKV